MPSRDEIRQVHIALAVLVVIVLVGGFLVRDAGEAAMQLVGLVGLVACFGTAVVLLERLERRQKRSGRDQ
ncbi:MAG TPA: hypothetical protein VFY04_09465 [Solirubrobacterales bacterium]|nr:hypothetical protein [Solirubrobacterales bacterium]